MTDKEKLKELEELKKACMYSKDNYTDEDRKVLCDGCEEECIFNKKEEPASEDLEQAIDNYLATYWGGEKEKQEWPFLKKMAIHFAEWQKEQFEKNRLKHCDSITNEQAELEQGFIDQHLDKHQRMPTFLDAVEYGMRLQKEQLMAKAVDGVVHRFDGCGVASVHYNDPNGIPMAYFIPSEGLSAGDKVKIITIKEE